MKIDLEREDASELVGKLAGMKHTSVVSILKFKLLEVTVIELFTYLISLAIIIPYLVILAQGNQPLEVFDTIAKLVIGAYLGRILKKE